MDVMTPKSILVCFSESPVRMSCMASTQEEDVSSVWTATVLNLAERSCFLGLDGGEMSPVLVDLAEGDQHLGLVGRMAAPVLISLLE